MGETAVFLLGGIAATLLWETAGADWLEERNWRWADRKLPWPQRKVLAMATGQTDRQRRRLICAQWLSPEDEDVWYEHFQGLLTLREGRFFLDRGMYKSEWWEVGETSQFGKRKPENYWYEITASDGGKIVRLTDFRVGRWRYVPIHFEDWG